MVITVIFNYFKTKGRVGPVSQQNCKASLRVISNIEKKKKILIAFTATIVIKIAVKKEQ